MLIVVALLWNYLVLIGGGGQNRKYCTLYQWYQLNLGIKLGDELSARNSEQILPVLTVQLEK